MHQKQSGCFYFRETFDRDQKGSSRKNSLAIVRITRHIDEYYTSYYNYKYTVMMIAVIASYFSY